MVSIILIFVLSVAGICETSYLIRKRVASQHPVCFIGQKCEAVLASKYSKTFFIHNDILGLLSYVSILVITTLLLLGFLPAGLLMLGLEAILMVGSLMSLFFVFLQWKVIKAWCFWCMMSAFTFWSMGLILLLSNLF